MTGLYWRVEENECHAGAGIHQKWRQLHSKGRAEAAAGSESDSAGRSLLLCHSRTRARMWHNPSGVMVEIVRELTEQQLPILALRFAALLAYSFADELNGL